MRREKTSNGSAEGIGLAFIGYIAPAGNVNIACHRERTIVQRSDAQDGTKMVDTQNI
jgi:hypothetical protein